MLSTSRLSICIGLAALGAMSQSASIELWGDVTPTATGWLLNSAAQTYASIGYANTPRTAVIGMGAITSLSAEYQMLNNTPFAGGAPRFSVYFGTPDGSGIVPADNSIYIYWSNPVNTTPAPGWNNTGNAWDVSNTSVTWETSLRGALGVPMYMTSAADKQTVLNAIGGYSLRSLWIDLDAGWSSEQSMEVKNYRLNNRALGEPSVPGPAAILPFAVGLVAAARRRIRK